MFKRRKLDPEPDDEWVTVERIEPGPDGPVVRTQAVHVVPSGSALADGVPVPGPEAFPNTREGG